MDKLITALAPVFAAGLGIQQLGEILSPVIDKISPNYKKIILGLISLLLGLILAFMAKLHVLQLLGVTPSPALDPLDAIVTGFIISGGTEGVNSILKFLKYTKEDKKSDAAAKAPSNEGAKVADSGASADALSAMNQK
jgi:uncharacterized protein YacL